MEDPTLHDAAAKLAHSKGSWMPFTTPGVSAAARALAERSNESRTHAPVRASARKAPKTKARTAKPRSKKSAR